MPKFYCEKKPMKAVDPLCRCEWVGVSPGGIRAGTQARGHLPDGTRLVSQWSVARSPNQWPRAGSCVALSLPRGESPVAIGGPSSVLP